MDKIEARTIAITQIKSLGMVYFIRRLRYHESKVMSTFQNKNIFGKLLLGALEDPRREKGPICMEHGPGVQPAHGEGPKGPLMDGRKKICLFS